MPEKPKVIDVNIQVELEFISDPKTSFQINLPFVCDPLPVVMLIFYEVKRKYLLSLSLCFVFTDKRKLRVSENECLICSFYITTWNNIFVLDKLMQHPFRQFHQHRVGSEQIISNPLNPQKSFLHQIFLTHQNFYLHESRFC